MKLLVDAGNTRLKLSWAAAGSTVRADEVAAFDYADLQAAADWVAGLPDVVSMVCGVSVVAAQRKAQVEVALMAGIQAGIQAGKQDAQTAPPTIHWLTSQPQAGGVRNDYAPPQQLGADRWAALLGVAAHERRQQQQRQRLAAAEQQAAPAPVLLASFGTATTLDALLPAADVAQAGYVFPGGLILPGVALMRQSLSHGTAKLPLIQTSDPPQSFPNNTVDAISAGIAAAQAGALWRQWQLLRQYDRNNCPKLFVTGGAWSLVEAHIRQWFDASSTITYLQAPALDGLASLTIMPFMSFETFP